MSRSHPSAFPPSRLSRNTAAFSFLETAVSLVVVAVLFVLSAAVISSMRKSAGAARCVSNLRQLGGAIFAYATEHNGILPPGRDYTDGVKYWFMDRNMWAYHYLGRGLETARLFRCPSDGFVTDHKYYYSYTWNVELLQDWPPKASARNPNASKIRLVNASGKVLMADGASNAERTGESPNSSSMGSAGPIHSGSKSAANLSKRHHGGANALMGDGRVQWYLYDDLLTPARLLPSL